MIIYVGLIKCHVTNIDFAQKIGKHFVIVYGLKLHHDCTNITDLYGFSVI